MTQQIIITEQQNAQIAVINARIKKSGKNLILIFSGLIKEGFYEVQTFQALC